MRKVNFLALTVIGIMSACSSTDSPVDIEDQPPGYNDLVPVAGPGWYWQNPLPHRLSLSAISLADADVGYSVWANHILKTSDGGLSWQFVYTDTESYFLDVAAANRDVAAAVGEGVMAVTRDGGETWEDIPIAASERLVDVEFNDGVGAIIGYSGSVQVSFDDGATWTARSTGVTREAKQIVPLTRNDLIALNVHGDLLLSYNGGLGFARVHMGFDFVSHSISFADSNYGYAIDVNGATARTSDGGMRWALQGGVVPAPFSQVCAVSADEAVVVGPGGTIQKTVDGGTTWSPKAGLSGDFMAVDIGSGGYLTAVGMNGATARSHDAGDTWVMLQRGATDNLTAIELFGPDQGIAVGYSGLILVKGKGDDIWSARPSWTLAQLTDLAILGSGRAIAVGHEGTILRTTDEGETWTAVEGVSNQNIFRAVAIDDSSAVAVGGYEFLFTVDAGETWTVRNHDPGYYVVSFENVESGVLVSEDGLVYSTTDGGASWSHISQIASDHVKDVCSVDPGIIVASGYRGIWRSVDGGASWDLTHDPGFTYVSRVQFVDSEVGYAISGAAIYRSSDGGATWQVDLRDIGHFQDLGFYDRLNGSLVGLGGTVLHTYTGGSFE